MVMEAVTLSGPQRKCNVIPVQKSLSLPSYAKAGGGGIDHMLIFAALEQKEKTRRKSKIFTKEKTARQKNIFCLPISSGSKCRETSLSSDTSCSSLEYQKPKTVSKPKKEDTRQVVKPIENDLQINDRKTSITSGHESKSNTEYVRRDILNRHDINGDSEHNHSLRVNDHRKGHRSPVENFRLNVGSSDSMERSSRSSNDSLTRKERLVAIKARVEAEREKYGNSSSEDDSRSSMTRYNSDGVIHRTVREVKSRSYRLEKRLRRRSQDEWALKKPNRKNNLSLCLNPEDDGIKLHLEKLNQMNNEINNFNNLEVKTDCCPSPNFSDITKKNYFSDFPSRENVSRFVQQRIKLIEEEERKRRSGSDFYDKIRSSPRLSPLCQEKSTHASTEHIMSLEKKTVSRDYISDNRSTSTEIVRRGSPIPKSSQAPTPPPRSPKSITFVNKAFLQHQNATLQHQENSLERKKFFQPNITAITPTGSPDKFNTKSEVVIRNTNYPAQLHGNSRDLFNARRKTCGNFDFVDQNIMNDLGSTARGALGYSNSNLATTNKNSSSLSQIKNIDNKGCVTNAEASLLPTACERNKSWLNKWEESERKREFMFNSLESNKKANALPWVKWKSSSENTDLCVCYPNSENKKYECTTCNVKVVDKNTNSINKQFSVFDTHENKQMFNGTSHSKWKIFSEVKDKCMCYVLPGNKICKCNTPVMKEQNRNNKNVPIQSLGFENNHPICNKEQTSRTDLFLSGRFNNSQVDVIQSDTFQALTRVGDEMPTCNSNEIAKSYDGFKRSYSGDSSATANLESAMAELESVYRSLKFSSDTLSDRNSLSNISLSDEDSKVFAKDNKIHTVNEDSHFKRLSVHDSSDFNVVSSPKTNEGLNRTKLLTDHRNSPRITPSIHSTKEAAFYKEFSINELFNDLTCQLDNFEEKSMPCENQIRQTTSCRHIGVHENKSHVNDSPINIKKEFYDNLQNQKVAPPKRKLKAVRSLSENISHLMAADHNYYQPTSEGLNIDNNARANNNLSSTITSTSHDVYKPNMLNLTKHEVPSNSRLVCGTNDLQNPKQKEIRHVRVSMDSTSPQPIQAPVNMYSNTSQYSRLSSAVCSPQMSPKGEKSNSFQPVACSSSKENIDKTIDGLEELLSSLLCDVPQSNQSSLRSTEKNTEPSTPPPPVSAGEMRVLQHLDVIRLKPVPS